MATQILKTVKPSGGDYTSLIDAINGNAQDLVANDKYLTIEISGSWASADTGQVTGFSFPYTTDATHYIEIYTTGSAKHQGVYSSNYYRLEVSNGFGPAMSLNKDYITVRGLQIKNTYSANTFDSADGVSISSGNITLDSCLVYAPQKAIGVAQGASSGIVISNCIAISQGATSHASGSAISLNAGASALNCIAINRSSQASNTGPALTGGSGSNLAKNCYAYTAGSGVAFATSNVTITTCASHDTSGTSGLQSIAYSTSSGAKFTSTTADVENFNLSGGSALTDVGTDLSATFTNDITGTTRGGTWDIGVFAATASSSSSSCRSSSSSSSSRSSSSSSRSSSSSSGSSSKSSSSSSSSSSSRSSSSSSSSSSNSSSSSSSSSSCRSSSSSSNSLASSSSSSCRSSSSSSSSLSSSSSSSSCRSSSSSSSLSSSSSSSCRSSSSSSSSSSRSSSSSSSSSSCRSSSSSSSKSSSSCSSSSSALLGGSKTYTRQDVNGLPTNDNDLGTAFSPAEYVQTQFLDGVTVSQASIQTHAVFEFKDQYSSNIPFTVTWVGKSNKSTVVAPIVLQIYNRTLLTWETLATNNTTPAGQNITLTASKLSTINDYYDAGHSISCRVYQQAT